MSLSSLKFANGSTASDLASVGPEAIVRDGVRWDQNHPPAATAMSSAATAPASQGLRCVRGGVPLEEMIQIGTGVAMFLNDSRPPNSACTVILFFTVSYTVCERQMPPGGALVCTRAAMFTPSP